MFQVLMTGRIDHVNGISPGVGHLVQVQLASSPEIK